MRYDVSVIGLYLLDILGRPVSRIPERGDVDFIDEIRLTVAGTAGGTVVDTAKLGPMSLAMRAVGDPREQRRPLPPIQWVPTFAGMTMLRE